MLLRKLKQVTKNKSPLVPSGFNKILIISSEFPPNVGGIGNHAYNLARALASEGFKVEVLTDTINVHKNELERFSLKQSFKIHWIDRKRFVVTTYLHRIIKCLTVAENAEKVICSGKFYLWIAVLLRARYPKKELTAVVHGTELDLKSPVSKKLTTYSLGCFNKVIAVSNYTRQFIPKSLPDNILQFVIHNGINSGEFDINDFSVLSGHPALITIGNVTERKGQENVIKALPEIAIKYPFVRYHVVGKPTNKEKIEKCAKELQVEDRVQFYGAVDRTELLQKLKGSAIKVMLSNHTSDGDFEGFGIAVLEANAFGVPAIGSKDCGLADAIEHEKTGLLVDQYNAKEVANAVKKVMDSYSCFSSNAKNWAVQHDWKIIVKKYVAALIA